MTEEKVAGFEEIEKFIVIVTYGRSGSTLLMKILNTLDGAVIRGENGNLLVRFFRAVEAAREARRKHRKNAARKGGDHPWHGIEAIRPGRLEKQLGRLFYREVLRPPEGTRITGFKEIRYPDMERKELESYLGFLERIFGERLHVVFNRRRLEDVARSAWWGKMPPEKVIRNLEPMDRWMVEYARLHPERSFLVEYDRYRDDPGALAPLFEWMEEPFDLRRIAAVLMQPLYHGRKKGEGRKTPSDCDGSI